MSKYFDLTVNKWRLQKDADPGNSVAADHYKKLGPGPTPAESTLNTIIEESRAQFARVQYYKAPIAEQEIPAAPTTMHEIDDEIKPAPRTYKRGWTAKKWANYYEHNQKEKGPIVKPFEAAQIAAMQDISQDATFDKMGTESHFDDRDNMNPETFPEPDHEQIPFIGWLKDPAE